MASAPDGKATSLLHQFETACALVADESTRRVLELLSQLIQDVRESLRTSLEAEVDKAILSIEWRPHLKPCGRAIGPPARRRETPAIPQTEFMASDRRDISSAPATVDQLSPMTDSVFSAATADLLPLTAAQMTPLSAAELRAPLAAELHLRPGELASAAHRANAIGAPWPKMPLRSALATGVAAGARDKAVPKALGDSHANAPAAPRKLLLAAERERAFKAKQQPPAWEPIKPSQPSQGSPVAKAVFTATETKTGEVVSDAKSGSSSAEPSMYLTAEERLRDAQLREESARSTLPLWLKISAGMPTRAVVSPSASSEQQRQDETRPDRPDDDASKSDSCSASKGSCGDPSM